MSVLDEISNSKQMISFCTILMQFPLYNVCKMSIAIESLEVRLLPSTI